MCNKRFGLSASSSGGQKRGRLNGRCPAKEEPGGHGTKRRDIGKALRGGVEVRGDQGGGNAMDRAHSPLCFVCDGNTFCG